MALKNKPQVILGTPGRVIDHLEGIRLKFGSLKMLVLDEADEMLEHGIAQDIDVIIEDLPEERRRLYSATLAHEIKGLSKIYI